MTRAEIHIHHDQGRHKSPEGTPLGGESRFHIMAAQDTERLRRKIEAELRDNRTLQKYVVGGRDAIRIHKHHVTVQWVIVPGEASYEEAEKEIEGEVVAIIRQAFGWSTIRLARHEHRRHLNAAAQAMGRRLRDHHV